jgi:hypothetical protein
MITNIALILMLMSVVYILDKVALMVENIEIEEEDNK